MREASPIGDMLKAVNANSSSSEFFEYSQTFIPTAGFHRTKSVSI